MRIFFACVIGMLFVSGLAAADTVRLKNGNVVEGKILEKTAEKITMDIGGVTLTYYADEIDSLNPSASSATAAALPVVPAEAAGAVPQAQMAAPVDAPKTTWGAGSEDVATMSKDQLIRKFVQIYGVKENMQANFDQMTASLKPEQAQAFRTSVKVDEIIEQLVPVYDQHFSADDLRAYIHFYSSPEGKKLVQALPLLMKDSVDVSMKYLDAHLPESLKQGDPTPASM